MSTNEINAIKAVYPEFTRAIGQAMWCVFTGNFPNGKYRNVYLPSGELCQHTHRTWGQIIADARGHKKEDYITYWESRVPEDKVRKIEKKFKKAGWKFAEEPVDLDANEKLRNETLLLMDDAQLSLSKTTPQQAMKSFNNAVYGALGKPIENKQPKKRGRPKKVK